MSRFEADRWSLDATLIEPHAYPDDVVDGRISSDQTTVHVVARDGSIWRRSLIDHSDRFVRSAIAPSATFADARFVDDDTLVSIEGDGARWNLWRVELASGQRTLCRRSQGRSGTTVWHATFGPFVEARFDRGAALAHLDGEAWVVRADGLVREVRRDAAKLIDDDAVLCLERDEASLALRGFVFASLDGAELCRLRIADPRIQGIDTYPAPIVLDADHLLLLRERRDEQRAVDGVVFRWRDDTCVELHAFLSDRGGAVLHHPVGMGHESERHGRWLPTTVAKVLAEQARSGFVEVLDHSGRWVVYRDGERHANNISVIDLATREHVTDELRGRALRAWPNRDASTTLTTHVDGRCCLWDARRASLLDERVVRALDLHWIRGDTAVVATASDDSEQRWVQQFSCADAQLELVSERPLAPHDRRVLACHPDGRWALIDRTTRDERGAKRWLVALASIIGDATGERAWLSKLACFDGDSVLLATERAVSRLSIDGGVRDAEVFASSAYPCALNRFGAVTRQEASPDRAHQLIVDRANGKRSEWRSDAPILGVVIASDAPVLAAHLGDALDGSRRERVELRSFDGSSLGSVTMNSDGDGVESIALSADGAALVVVSRRGAVYVLRDRDSARDASRPRDEQQ